VKSDALPDFFPQPHLDEESTCHFKVDVLKAELPSSEMAVFTNTIGGAVCKRGVP